MSPNASGGRGTCPLPPLLCVSAVGSFLRVSAGYKGIGDLLGVRPSADMCRDCSDSSWGRKQLCKGSLGYSRC